MLFFFGKGFDAKAFFFLKLQLLETKLSVGKKVVLRLSASYI